MDERVLVIGATGFIGRQIVRELVEEDHSVVAMRRWNSDIEPLRRWGVEEAVGDVLDRDDLRSVLSTCNHVIYAAAPDVTLPGDAYRRQAVRAIRNVLQVGRDEGIERIVVTSSAATLGPPEERSRADESRYYLPGTARDPFVEAAYAVEQECYRQAADGQYIVLLNPTLVVGPGARIPERRAIAGVADDAPLNVVHVRAVARAHRQALERGEGGERYIIGGENTTLRHFYARADQLVDGFIERPRFGTGDVPFRDRHLLRDGMWVETTKAEKRLEGRQNESAGPQTPLSDLPSAQSTSSSSLATSYQDSS